MAKTALVGIREGQGLDGDVWTWEKLHETVRTLRGALLHSGIRSGERIGAGISTSVWSVALVPAAASIGAVWTSIASDIGEKGCISRLDQISPKILFADSSSIFKGKSYSPVDKITNIVARLNQTPQVLIPLFGKINLDLNLPFPALNTFLARAPPSDPLTFARVPYSHPLYILYTSGTTGAPNCLVRAHSVIIQHKTSLLHNSLTQTDTVFQYSSTSWHHRVTYWGTSPRYLHELEMSGHVSRENADLDLGALRMVQTGGSHLAASQYHWFYTAFPQNIHLTSVPGGTDLVTSWIGTDPAGGFVCRTPFPSMPVFFWGDGERMEKYRETYFDFFPHFWAQHDWANFNPATRGWRIHGRSDGVLNPQGIRFGSSDIYSIVEAAPFNNTISTTLCVGRRRELVGLNETDETVFLFVVIQPPHRLTEDLVRDLKDAIRRGLSNRHGPRFVLEVPAIPVTVNAKRSETLVKGFICSGEVPRTVSNTVQNPGCLGAFWRFYELDGDGGARAAKL
ncbi:hypothetical protein BJX62DRAFT_224617 [Aspergillus germanicus]